MNNLVNQPKRMRPKDFLKSIEALPLRNRFLPEFDCHAIRLERELNSRDRGNMSIGAALLTVNDQQKSEAFGSLSFSLKQIIFGYAVTNSWTVWASLEHGTPIRVVPDGLFECSHFVVATDFSAATYGSLNFRISRVDRLDLMTHAGEQRFDETVWSEHTTMSAVNLQRVRPNGLRCRSVSLERMLKRNDLTTESRTVPKCTRKRVFHRTREYWADKSIVTGGKIDAFTATGSISVTSSASPKMKRSRGRQSKLPYVKVGFFQWMAVTKMKKLPAMTSAKQEIADTLGELKRSKNIEQTADPVTIRKHLIALGYYVPADGHEVMSEWIPSAWHADFKSWKQKNKITH